MLLTIEPLSKENFSSFGDVIECVSQGSSMNTGMFQRFNHLATIDVCKHQGYPSFSIAQSQLNICWPFKVEYLERHRLGSQLFYPLFHHPFYIVVAPPGEGVTIDSIRAFKTNGSQGVNYFAGVWHMPMLSLKQGDSFIIVDRWEQNAPPDCEERIIDKAELFLDGSLD